jgi:hypothetical protein
MAQKRIISIFIPAVLRYPEGRQGEKPRFYLKCMGLPKGITWIGYAVT